VDRRSENNICTGAIWQLKFIYYSDHTLGISTATLVNVRAPPAVLVQLSWTGNPSSRSTWFLGTASTWVGHCGRPRWSRSAGLSPGPEASFPKCNPRARWHSTPSVARRCCQQMARRASIRRTCQTHSFTVGSWNRGQA